MLITSFDDVNGIELNDPPIRMIVKNPIPFVIRKGLM